MTDRETVQEFMSQRTLALVGVSRGGKKFGNSVLKELTARATRSPIARSRAPG